MFHVYILRTSANTLYVGQTNNIEKRIKEHQAKTIKSSKYVRSFASFELVYSEQFDTRSEAMKREYELKQLTKVQKEKLVAKGNK
jgi:putative endonuclease